jgi:hypothetical protein
MSKFNYLIQKLVLVVGKALEALAFGRTKKDNDGYVPRSS